MKTLLHNMVPAHLRNRYPLWVGFAALWRGRVLLWNRVEGTGLRWSGPPVVGCAIRPVRRIAWAVALVLGVGSSAYANEVTFDIIAGAAQATGSIEYFEGGLGQSMPSRLILSYAAGFNSGSPTHTWEVYIEQTQVFIAGNYIPITPRFCMGSVSGTTTSGTPVNLLSPFLATLYGATGNADPTYKTGKYRVVFRVKHGSTEDERKEYEFVLITLQGSDQYPNGNGAGSGGGSGVGANGATEEEQQGFWSGLFVPSGECLADLKDAALQFTEWGPLGMLNQAVEELGDQESVGAFMTVSTGVAPGSSSSMTVDTSPWTTLLETFRALIAGGIWFGVIWSAWAMARKLMV